MAEVIQRYLETMSADGCGTLARQLSHALDAVLVVPAYDEPAHALQSILSHPAQQRLAIVLVINAPDSAPACALRRTRVMAQELKHRFGMGAAQREGSAKIGASRTVFIIDRTASDALIPAKQGVGLARKLGLDLALALSEYSREHFASPVRWLYSTDADVHLPDDYFDAGAAAPEEASALVYPFAHRAEAGFELAMRMYEFKLHYYVNGLQWAGSPYGYHSIGSTLAVRPLAYAQVRGVPRRAGGEDFYLLNKLAKLGSIVSLTHPVIHIQGRPSARVPFGTGPALGSIAQMDDPMSDFGFYHPFCFQALQYLQQAAEAWGHTARTSADFLVSLKAVCRDAEQTECIWQGLHALKVERLFRHVATQRPSDLTRQFHDWFDAFQTLKFVHYLRDAQYASLNARELWQHRADLPPPTRTALAALLQREGVSTP